MVDCHLLGFLTGDRFDLGVMNPGLDAIDLDCSWGSQDHNVRAFPARTRPRVVFVVFFFFLCFTQTRPPGLVVMWFDRQQATQVEE